MTFGPRSIHGRMLALSLLATTAALGAAGIAIGGVLDRFVTRTLDARLGDKLIGLSAAVRGDGGLDRAQVTRFATLGAPDTDWRIEAPGGVAGSASADGRRYASFAGGQSLGPIAAYRHPGGHRAPPPPIDGHAGPRPFDTRLRDGTRVHGRWDIIATGRGPAWIAVAVSRDLIDRPVRAALVPLALSLLALGLALAAAMLVQLRLGLRPLRTFRAGVLAIREGRRRTLPEDQPAELRPLAVELNALVADNAAALAVARASAANLAHGLKTPVATLGLALAQPGRDPDGTLAAQVARIDATIRHHLARARASVADPRAATALAPAIRDLADTIARLHPDRAVAIQCDVADLTVAVGAQDLDELAGNLIENAVRHARSRVAITAAAGRRHVRLSIADDGPGIAAADRRRATQPGLRLDERGDGHGFGLTIARDLAMLHGGGLALDEPPGGGLLATVTLPLAPGSIA